MDRARKILANAHPLRAIRLRGKRATHPLELARRRAGLTMEELAARTGLAISTIHRIERGKERARPATMRLIELALAVLARA
jgi:DNA-binding XRE family transcriptional regulator